MSLVVYDVIYGRIFLSELCTKFAQTQEFERLKNIQNTYSHPIFTSLHVTRYEHSIGTMYLAIKLGTQFNLDKRTLDLLSLASLCHDIGHVATSHTLDDILIQKGLPNHEIRSVLILKRINNRLHLLNPSEVEIVSNMILGIGDSFLYEIVHNNNNRVHDLDRLDYLNRDGYFIGNVQVNALELLGCYRIVNNHLDMDSNLVDFIYQVRRYMFENVYQCIEIIERNKKITMILNDIIVNINNFDWLLYTDHWLSSKL